LPILESRQLLWPDEAACERFARELARCPGLMDCSIELHGALGAGKTSFVRHLLRGLGVTGRVKSPSYAVLESYAIAGLGTASHFDFYRFDDPREWEDAGFRDVFAAPGLKLSEWPEKAAGVLPPPDLGLHLEALPDDTRRVRVDAYSTRGVALLRGLEGEE